MWAINVLIHFQGLPDDAGIHMLSVSLYICLFNFYFVLFLFFLRSTRLWLSCGIPVYISHKVMTAEPDTVLYKTRPRFMDPAQRAKPSLWEDNDAILRMKKEMSAAH